MESRIMGDTEITVDEIMNKGEVEQVFKLNPRTLQYLISTHQIPYSRVGKRTIRFSRRRLMEWMREREGVAYRMERKERDHTPRVSQGGQHER